MKIEIPKGYEIDKLTTTEITLKKIEPKLPKSWEELEIKGYWVDNDSEISKVLNAPFDKGNKNVFKTKEQAQASIALAQLSQLMAVYNRGWEPDWTTPNELKTTIVFSNEEIFIDTRTYNRVFLAFKEEGIAVEFLKNFRDLIEQAKPLL